MTEAKESNVRKPGVIQRLRQSPKFRRWFPRGNAVWYPFARAKRFIAGVRHPSQRRKILLHRAHGNILLEEFSAIYFFIPKVACSSLKKVCARLLKMSLSSGEEAEDVHQLDFPYAKRHRIATKYADYFKFCFVRDPWSRLVSCYRDKVNYHKDHVYDRYDNRFVRYFQRMGIDTEDMTFERFVEVVCEIPDDLAESHFESQYRFISDDSGNLLADFVGRFERLEDDFRHVAERLGTDIALPHLRPTKHRDPRQYYTERLGKLVAKRYERDLELFGYEV